MNADSWQQPVPTGIKSDESEQIRIDTEAFLKAGGKINYANPGESSYMAKTPEERRRHHNNRV